jgi:hypothetical protein
VQASAAEAFVRQYFATLNEMVARVPGATTKPLYSAACTGCAGDYANIAGVQSHGATLTGMRFGLTGVETIDVGPSDLVYVVSELTEAAGTLVSRSGSVMETYQAQGATIQSVLKPQGQSFVLVQLSAVS